MRFGTIGLGSMGGNMALLVPETGREVVGYSRSEEPRLAEAGVEIVSSAKELAGRLAPRRVVLLGLSVGEQVWGVRHTMAREVTIPSRNQYGGQPSREG